MDFNPAFLGRAFRKDRFVPNPKLRLQDQFHEVARFRQVSLRTEEAYWHWVHQFLLFWKGQAGAWRHPKDMGGAEVKTFLADLASVRKVAISTQNQALNVLVFLYREVLGQEFGALGEYARPQRREKLPVVLTKPEVAKVLTLADPNYGLVLKVLYGTGMRLLEGLRLRVKDVDFEANQVIVREGKGFKDRVTMLPDAVKERLQLHLERVRLLHEDDLHRGCGEVYLPLALSRKHPTAGRDWCWQYAVCIPFYAVVQGSPWWRNAPASCE